MKRIIALLLIIASLFALSSCMGTFYEPVPSTETEATTVMTFNIGGKKYEMKYELYRFLFLNYKSAVDGGDESVWSGEKKDEYIAKIEGIIIERALDIFSVFELAKRAGIDPYSAEVGKTVNNYINASIGEFESYDKYLAHLKSNNVNYSVQELMFRYVTVLDLIEEHYVGASNSDELEDEYFERGAIEYTDADVKAFYDSEDCARILRLTFKEGAFVGTTSTPDTLRAGMEKAASKGEFNVASFIANHSMTDGREIEKGYILGRHNLSDNIYGSLVETAFELELGEVSRLIKLHDGTEYIYHIVYRAQKSDDNYNENKTEITFVYLTNELGRMLDEISATMQESAVRTEFLGTLNYREISMD